MYNIYRFRRGQLLRQSRAPLRWMRLRISSLMLGCPPRGRDRPWWVRGRPRSRQRLCFVQCVCVGRCGNSPPILILESLGRGKPDDVAHEAHKGRCCRRGGLPTVRERLHEATKPCTTFAGCVFRKRLHMDEDVLSPFLKNGRGEPFCSRRLGGCFPLKSVNPYSKAASAAMTTFPDFDINLGSA